MAFFSLLVVAFSSYTLPDLGVKMYVVGLVVLADFLLTLRTNKSPLTNKRPANKRKKEIMD
jgi:hypothetical protein